jgi:hypothetical protein
LTAAAVVSLPFAARPGFAAGGTGPGAYCPLPEPGEIRQCLEPARARYGAFFSAVEEGELGGEQLDRLETDVAAGADSEDAYLALSSLSYGYLRVAQRLAADPSRDPVLVARLERWNDLLSRAFEVSPEDGRYRDAVREAALDVQRRAPAVSLYCTDEKGEPARCDTTEAVLRTLGRRRDSAGIRGALARLLGRIFGRDGS